MMDLSLLRAGWLFDPGQWIAEQWAGLVAWAYGLPVLGWALQFFALPGWTLFLAGAALGALIMRFGWKTVVLLGIPVVIAFVLGRRSSPEPRPAASNENAAPRWPPEDAAPARGREIPAPRPRTLIDFLRSLGRKGEDQ